MKKAIISIAACAMLAGCAAPPNTPGAGYGKNYTPVIDTQGVDQARYSKDLGDCRQFAGIVDADKAAMQGMIGGIIAGALMGAIIGGNHGMSRYGANYGATVGGGAGLGAAANKATNQQERIMINCMAGRGYRTLDGSAAPNSNYPSPYVQATTSTAPPAPPQQPSGASVIPPAAPKVAATTGGKNQYEAEQFAQQNFCALPVIPVATPGAPFETYSAACGNGNTIIMRCELGNCRALKWGVSAPN